MREKRRGETPPPLFRHLIQKLDPKPELHAKKTTEKSLKTKKPPPSPHPSFIEMWTLDIPLTALKNQLLFTRSLPNINGFTIVPDPWAYSERKIPAFGMFLQTLVQIIANRRPVGQFQEHPVTVHQGAVQTGDYTLHSLNICLKRLKNYLHDSTCVAWRTREDGTGQYGTGQDGTGQGRTGWQNTMLKTRTIHI